MKYVCHTVVSFALIAASVAAEEAPDTDFEPVHPDKLIALLPSGTRDFKAAKPKGTMSGELGSKITIASRVYTYNGADDELDEEEAKPTLTIKMTDSTATESFPLLHGKLASMGQTTTTGFTNALSIDGHLAIRNYREKDQVGLLSVYVADRFLVQVAVKGLPPETMMEWWNRIDDEKLAALAIPPTPTPVPTPSHTPASSS